MEGNRRRAGVRRMWSDGGSGEKPETARETPMVPAEHCACGAGFSVMLRSHRIAG